jgi:hypothetical protein
MNTTITVQQQKEATLLVARVVREAFEAAEQFWAWQLIDPANPIEAMTRAFEQLPAILAELAQQPHSERVTLLRRCTPAEWLVVVRLAALWEEVMCPIEAVWRAIQEEAQCVRAGAWYEPLPAAERSLVAQA